MQPAGQRQRAPVGLRLFNNNGGLMVAFLHIT
jgi:hypothetical protein